MKSTSMRRVVVLGLAGHRDVGRAGDLDRGIGDRREAPAVDADEECRGMGRRHRLRGDVSGSSVNSSRSGATCAPAGHGGAGSGPPSASPPARTLPRRSPRLAACLSTGRCFSAPRARAERPLPSVVQARQPRRERQPVEESPDTTWQGGRGTDPGKPAGKCHRNTPPMAGPLQSPAQARVKWCGKSAPASR